MNGTIPGGHLNTFHTSSFDCLLSSLDDDRDRAGSKYETVRHRLMQFFLIRRCLPADELADQTLDRVARRLENSQVHNLSAFIWGVARIIVLEFHRRPQLVSIEDIHPGDHPKSEDVERHIIRQEEAQRRKRCLRRSLMELSPSDRRLLLVYSYRARGREDKQQLARQFGYTEQGLRTRAHRVRRKVEMIALKYGGGIHFKGRFR